MIRVSFATLGLLLLLTAGCAHHRNDISRSEFQRTETTRTQDGNAQGTEINPGSQSEERETVRIHRESTTTEQNEK